MMMHQAISLIKSTIVCLFDCILDLDTRSTVQTFVIIDTKMQLWTLDGFSLLLHSLRLTKNLTVIRNSDISNNPMRIRLNKLCFFVCKLGLSRCYYPMLTFLTSHETFLVIFMARFCLKNFNYFIGLSIAKQSYLPHNIVMF